MKINDTMNLNELAEALAEVYAQRDVLLEALRIIADSEEHHGETVVCDFATLQGVARAALNRAKGGDQ